MEHLALLQFDLQIREKSITAQIEYQYPPLLARKGGDHHGCFGEAAVRVRIVWDDVSEEGRLSYMTSTDFFDPLPSLCWQNLYRVTHQVGLNLLLSLI